MLFFEFFDSINLTMMSIRTFESKISMWCFLHFFSSYKKNSLQSRFRSVKNFLLANFRGGCFQIFVGTKSRGVVPNFDIDIS
jgi:hypothetical protein